MALEVKAKKVLAGLVLAGGLSKRMGSDKALICPFGGKSFLQLASAKLSAICAEVYVSTAYGHVYENFACISDDAESRGPISGIHASLERLQKYDGIFALACDMPLVTHELLANLTHAWLNAAQNCGMAAWQSRLSGKIQTLAAIYASSSLPFFRQALADGRYGLWNVVPENMRLCLPYGPEDEQFFHNCNTQSDLAAMKHGMLEA